MKQRFYKISGLNERGVPGTERHMQLAQVATGFAMTVGLPVMPGFDQRLIVIDQPPANIEGLRTRIKQLFPEISEYVDDYSLGASVNEELLVKGEQGQGACQRGSRRIRAGDCRGLRRGKCNFSKFPCIAITAMSWLSFRDAVNTSLYALAKASLLSTALKDNHDTTVLQEIIENLPNIKVWE